jgi:CHAT domain-containing protein/tetratricopeptide (TPR) repeat protein
MQLKIFNLLTIVVLLTSQIVLCQKPSPIGQKLIDEGFKYYSAQQFEVAFQIYSKAVKQFKVEKDTSNILFAYAQIYGVLNATVKQTEFLKYEGELKPYFNTNKFTVVTIFNLLAGAYEQNGDFDKTKEYLDKAISKVKSYPKLGDEAFFTLGNTYNQMGLFYAKLGDFQKSDLNHQESLVNYLKIQDKLAEDSVEIFKQYGNVAINWIEIKKFNTAKNLLDKSEKIVKKINEQFKIDFHKNYALLFFPSAFNKPDSAIYHIKKALFYQESLNLKHLSGSSYTLLGDLYLEMKQYDKALLAYQKALEFRRASSSNLPKIRSIISIASVYNELKQPQKALNVLVEGNVLNMKVKSNRFSVENITYKSEALKALLVEAKAFSLLQNGHDKILSNRLKSNQLIDYQRNSFELEASKLELGKIAKEIYGLGIVAAYEKYQLTKDKKYLDLAFEYAEKSKNIVLFEAVKTSQTTKFGNVPKELIERERKLNQYLAVYENQMLKDKDHQDNWRKKLLESTKELEELKERIENKYPDYYQYKYENKPISVSEVQGKLTDNQALISYILQENSLYILAISSKDQMFVKQNLAPDFQAKFSKFRNLLITKASDKSYIASSYNIYENLFPKTIQDFLTKNNTQKLKIIADGYIHYLPFEALIINKLAKLKANNIYLLEKFTINYLPSATFQWKLTNSSSNLFLSKAYTAFSPNFQKPFDLPFNRRNVEYLASNISSKTYLNNEANLVSYLANSPQSSGIMHMSMHGAASASDPMDSYLSFGKDTLFAHDVYAQNIAAKLTVLDACETGLGNLNEGEGVMSLARAYLHAGSQAVAMSLWKLPSNEATGQIIRDFIELSNSGIEKDEALRTAKLNYLNAHRKDLLAGHPYFWAPMVVVGNAAPISSGYFTWIILGFLAVGFGLVWRMRK